MSSNNKVFNLYNAVQHIIFSISFLENIITSVTDEKEIAVYENLISNLRYFAEKACDLLELEVSFSDDLNVLNKKFTGTSESVLSTYDSVGSNEVVSEEIKNYINQIKEEIKKEKDKQ